MHKQTLRYLQVNQIHGYSTSSVKQALKSVDYRIIFQDRNKSQLLDMMKNKFELHFKINQHSNSTTQLVNKCGIKSQRVKSRRRYSQQIKEVQPSHRVSLSPLKQLSKSQKLAKMSSRKQQHLRNYQLFQHKQQVLFQNQLLIKPRFDSYLPKIKLAGKTIKNALKSKKNEDYCPWITKINQNEEDQIIFYQT